MLPQNSSRPPVDSAPLHASVIVCTYNRAGSLARTLACLAKQDVPPTLRWEVVVVDNNSRDETRTVVQDAQRRWPILRYEFEAQQGLSHARNHGIEVAHGGILLFTDDDVCPEPDWVPRILDGMTQHGCDACGGYIAPEWEVQPPPWLTERFHGFLAVRATSTHTVRITSLADAPFGANMAFRCTVFKKYGRFDVTRGRKGNVLSSGEDGELFERLLSGGAMVMYFGDAKVRHRVEGFRVTKRYFRRWRYETSRNIALSRGFPGARRLWGIPLYFFPQLARAVINALKAQFTQPRDEAFYREIIVWHFLGVMSGLAQDHRQGGDRDSGAAHENRY